MAIRLDAHRDEQHRDQQWHKPCRVATTASITIATALNNGDTLDGVTLVTGDRVLVKDQSSGAENGIYIVGASPARAYDLLAGIQAMGSFVWVRSGTANGQKLFYNSNTTLPTIDTDALTFAEFTAGGSEVVTVVAHGTMGSTETFDFTDGPVHTGTLDADLTVTLAGATTGEEAFLRIYFTQDGTGGWDITWPGSVVWPDGIAPTLDTTAGTVEIVEFTSTDGGTTWYGSHGGSLSDHDHSSAGAQGGSTLSPATLNLPSASSPAQTAEGSAVWDSDDDVLTVGTGAARKTFGYLGSTTPLVESGSGSAGTSKEVSAADHVHPAATSSSGIGDHEHMVDQFVGDGATTAFELTDEPLDPEAVVAFVAGSETAVTMSGTMNTTATFGAAPSAAARVIIQYPAVSV